MVGVKDGISIGTISKKSLPSAFGILPAFVTVAIISVVNVLLPALKKKNNKYYLGKEITQRGDHSKFRHSKSYIKPPPPPQKTPPPPPPPDCYHGLTIMALVYGALSGLLTSRCDEYSVLNEL